ncbi:MAG: hypothetical protein IKG66_04465 [Lachnospiraceae bacterium]|nr:hypothetical protein [Lachnospiraceae bacterium]
MSSKIEQQIDQIEDYIDSCRYQKFSKTNIIVDKDEIDGLLEELRAKTPDEIRHYQRIINNRDSILEEARRKAQEMINEANIHTNELVNEHEIVQAAHREAENIVRMATKEAQDIIDRANEQADSYRASAAQYLDDLLARAESDTASSLDRMTRIFSDLHGGLGEYLETLRQNRSELYGEAPEEETGDAQEEDGDYNEEAEEEE